MRIEGANVVVTGAGSGIGRALARAFAAQGARHVTLADIDREAVRAVAEEIGGGHAETDVSDPAAIAALVRQAEAEGGHVDIFCSNAGITVRGGPETPRAGWDRLWAVNVMAHVEAARLLLPSMVERGAGHLMCTASAAGLLSQFDAPYAVTKHAAVAFAEWLSITYRDRGIEASCLCPGGVDTPLLRSETAERQAAMGGEMMSPERVAEIALAGIEEGRFLILTHPEIAAMTRRRAEDPERWLQGMRRFHGPYRPDWP